MVEINRMLCFVSSLLSVDENATPNDTSDVTRRPPRNPLTARTVGAAIRQFRDAAAISQEQLAADAGVHRTFVGLVENGHRDASVGNIGRVLSALGISWAEFGVALDRLAANRRPAADGRTRTRVPTRPR